MKKILLIFVAMVAFSASSFAQKYGYVYSEKIFKAMPQYNEAIKAIENYVEVSKKLSEVKLTEVKNMFQDFAKIEGSLSTTARKERQAEIIAAEREADKFSTDLFSEDGAVAKKQQELMKPIEDKVLAAVNALAAEGKYDMIFDLSASKITIYQSNSLDLTSQVISRLGY